MASAGLLYSGFALADDPAFQPSPGASKPVEPPFVERPSPAATPEPAPAPPPPSAPPPAAPAPIATAPAPSPIATAPAPSPIATAPAPPVAPMRVRPLGESATSDRAPGSVKPAAPKRPVAAQKAAPRRPKKAKKRRGDPASSAPAVTYPAFRMMEGGSSRVFVGVSRKVDVSEHKAQGQLVYRIQGAEVLSRTNQLALDTSFFATPVGRIRLVQQGSDVDLVVDLREAVDVHYRIDDTRDGIVLIVDFPPTRLTAPQAAPPSTETEPAVRTRARPATETTRLGSGPRS